MRLSRACAAVLVLAPAIGALGCVQPKTTVNTTTNVTVGPTPLPTPGPAPGPTPNPTRPGPSISVSYALGPGNLVCVTANCGGFIATSADGRSWNTTLSAGQNYKLFMIVRQGQVPGRTIDMRLTPGFNADPGTALRAIPEAGNPQSFILGYGFPARSGSLPVVAEVVEHTAGPDDMLQDFVYSNNVVLQSR